jgi:ribosomal protein S18 acetylase RimI-like enzyme
MPLTHIAQDLELPSGFEFQLASEKDLSRIEPLMQQYFMELGLKLDPGELDKDLDSFTDAYKDGGFLLITKKDTAVGCVGVRAMGPGRAELKRMYLKPGYRKLGLGGVLLQRGITLAREKGFESLFLDTRLDLKAANALYEKFGFKDIEDYNQNPRAERFMVLGLQKPNA